MEGWNVTFLGAWKRTTCSMASRDHTAREPSRLQLARWLPPTQKATQDTYRDSNSREVYTLLQEGYKREGATTTESAHVLMHQMFISYGYEPDQHAH